MKDQPQLLEVGKAEVIQSFANNGKKKVALFPLGPLGKMAKKTAELLGPDFDCAMVNPRFFKPLDDATTAFFAGAADVVVTFEDHAIPGGYGSAVIELLNDRGIRTPVVRIGWPDQFIEHASSVDYLRNKHGLTAENAAIQVKSICESAKPATRITAAA